MFVILDLLGRRGLDPKICAGRKLDGANRGTACQTSQCKGFRYAVCTYCQRDLSQLCGWVRSPIPAPPASTWRSRGVLTPKEMEDMAAADMDRNADDMEEVELGSGDMATVSSTRATADEYGSRMHEEVNALVNTLELELGPSLDAYWLVGGNDGDLTEDEDNPVKVTGSI